MGIFGRDKKADTKEMVREMQRKMRGEMRQLDRQVHAIEREEMKVPFPIIITVMIVSLEFQSFFLLNSISVSVGVGPSALRWVAFWIFTSFTVSALKCNRFALLILWLRCKTENYQMICCFAVGVFIKFFRQILGEETDQGSRKEGWSRRLRRFGKIDSSFTEGKYLGN